MIIFIRVRHEQISPWVELTQNDMEGLFHISEICTQKNKISILVFFCSTLKNTHTKLLRSMVVYHLRFSNASKASNIQIVNVELSTELSPLYFVFL